MREVLKDAQPLVAWLLADLRLSVKQYFSPLPFAYRLFLSALRELRKAWMGWMETSVVAHFLVDRLLVPWVYFYPASHNRNAALEAFVNGFSFEMHRTLLQFLSITHPNASTRASALRLLARYSGKELETIELLALRSCIDPDQLTRSFAWRLANSIPNASQRLNYYDISGQTDPRSRMTIMMEIISEKEPLEPVTAVLMDIALTGTSSNYRYSDFGEFYHEYRAAPNSNHPSLWLHRSNAIEALMAHASPEKARVQYILQLISEFDQEVNVRGVALRLLAKHFPGKTTTALLRKRRKLDTSGNVRLLACRLLVHGGGGWTGLPHLVWFGSAQEAPS